MFGVDLSTDTDFAPLVRRLLELAGELSGLDSTFLTAIDELRGRQEVVLARNTGDLSISEGLEVPWSDSLCRRALEGGPSFTAEVPAVFPDSAAAAELGIRTFATVAVRDGRGRTVGTVCGASTREVALTAGHEELLRTVALMIEQHLALRSARDALQQLALTDSLTMLPNRRHLEDELLRVTSAASRHGREVCVLLVDVDEFKAVNDTYGHDEGDDVLVEVASSLRARCRLEDVAGRWGGDEFVVICPATDLEGARALAERIRADVEARMGGRATVSIGVARVTGASLVAADDALYGAKASGRNCVAAA